MGRKPSLNPLGTSIHLRIDAAMTAQVDDELEIERAARPGLIIGRVDMARILMTEALAARAARRRGASKKK